MFARFLTLLPLAALAAVAAAAPNAPEARAAAVCNSGSQYCCNKKFTNVSDFKKDATSIIGLLLGLGANVGVDCTPITVIGALSNGAQCTQQTACCKDVKQNGVVNVQCTPVAVNV